MFRRNSTIAETVPTPGSAEFRDWTHAVAHRLAESGSRPVRHHLTALASTARHCNVAAVSASVLADRRQPEVAKARAFSRIVTALVALTPVADHAVTTAA